MCVSREKLFAVVNEDTDTFTGLAAFKHILLKSASHTGVLGIVLHGKFFIGCSTENSPVVVEMFFGTVYKMGDYESALFYIQRAKDNSKAEQQKEINEHHKAILRKCKK